MRLPTLFLASGCLFAQSTLKDVLEKQIIDPKQAQLDIQVYTASKVPPLPSFQTRAEWERYAATLRQRVLDQVVFRGEAVRWRDAKTKVEMLDYFAEGPGYRARKFRYEVIPGLWLPGHIYEPASMTGKLPVVLNVNGHEKTGNATPYIQWRCVNLARKGLIAVNPEWLGRGQMDVPELNHYRMPQIDLTGTSGVALFYLAHKRALDIAASHPNADPAKIAVTGLSGGGWQTIFLSSLDTRVAAAMPVAGYSSYVTRAQFPTLDLGDSEQTPSDLASVADYTHLTAMLAPRWATLAYNAKDTCCFRADYAIGPLIQAATPVYRLYDATSRLRYHVNHGDGHNYDADNREALYRMLRDSIAPGISVKDEDAQAAVRTADEMRVPLPESNLDFHKIALQLAEGQPRKRGRTMADLERVVRAVRFNVEASEAGAAKIANAEARLWKLRMNDTWTVPAVELTPANTNGSTALVIADAGRASAAAAIEELLKKGLHVVALDPFYFGESKIATRDFLFAMLLAGLGERPLGLQASQIVAAARHFQKSSGGAIAVHAYGPRASLAALIAQGLDGRNIRAHMHDGLSSLRDILTQDMTVDKVPEFFCFGLLESWDLPQIQALGESQQAHR